MKREGLSSPKRFVAGGKYSTKGVSGLVSPRQAPARASPKRYNYAPAGSPPRTRKTSSQSGELVSYVTKVKRKDVT